MDTEPTWPRWLLTAILAIALVAPSPAASAEPLSWETGEGKSYVIPALEIGGLLRTMYDPRNTLSQHVSAQLEQHFGDKVFKTLVPRNIRLAEAPSYGAPAVVWDRASKGAQAYLALAEEILAGAAAV